MIIEDYDVLKRILDSKLPGYALAFSIDGDIAFVRKMTSAMWNLSATDKKEEHNTLTLNQLLSIMKYHKVEKIEEFDNALFFYLHTPDKDAIHGTAFANVGGIYSRGKFIEICKRYIGLSVSDIRYIVIYTYDHDIESCKTVLDSIKTTTVEELKLDVIIINRSI